MRQAVSRALYAYWRGLGATGGRPERDALDLGALRGFLSETFVLDFDPAGGFPFRICGATIAAVFLNDLRGAPFLILWREADRDRVASIVRAAADDGSARLLLAEGSPAGLAPVRIEVMLLPLSHRGATHARMLGSLAARPGSDWLGLIGSGPMTLTASDLLAPQQRGVADPASAR